MREKLFNLFPPVAQASILVPTYQLDKRLGLDQTDKQLCVLTLTEKLVKSSIYRAGQSMRSPIANRLEAIPLPLAHLFHAIGIRNPRIDFLMLRGYEDQLEDLNSSVKLFIDTHYSSPNARFRARTIELAVNDFFAIASDPSLDRPKLKPLQTIEPALEGWQKRWQEELLNYTDSVPSANHY